jgi:hypothetical protein
MSYSYDKFLRPITTTDKNIQIIDNTGIVKYTINPFSIVNVMISNNLLKINMKQGRVILINFSSTNESKLAISRLQEQIDVLTEKTPLFIDKQIENYVDDRINSVLNLQPTGATAATVTYDFSGGSIFYHGTASQNFTADFINIPTKNNRSITATIVLSQGPTAYVPNIVQIEGVTQSVKWAGGTYSGTADGVDIIGFTFIRSGGDWAQVLGQINTFSSI